MNTIVAFEKEFDQISLGIESIFSEEVSLESLTEVSTEGFKETVDYLKKQGTKIIAWIKSIGKAIWDFIQKHLSKINILKKRSKEKAEVIKSTEFEPTSIEVPASNIKYLLRGTEDIKNEYTLTELIKVIKNTNEKIDEFVSKSLIPMTSLGKEFSMVIKTNRFSSMNTSDPTIKPFVTRKDPVESLVRSKLRIKANESDTGEELSVSGVEKSVESFLPHFEWKYWDGESIEKNPELGSDTITIKVESETELASFNQLLLTSVAPGLDVMADKVDDYRKMTDNLASAYELFLKMAERKKLGNFWNAKRIKSLEKMIALFGKGTIITSKLTTYRLQVASQIDYITSQILKDG